MKKTQFLYLTLALCFLIGGFVYYRYKVPRFANGQLAKDFTTVLPDGRTARLSDLKGKYVLLHFWGSWCGPCRAENPGLVEVYKKYHDLGFEIFSIGIEKDQQRWQRAIEKDGLTWPLHFSDFRQFDGPIAKMYGVWQIPATWLLDPEGKVIGLNILPEKLDKILSERLK